MCSSGSSWSSEESSQNVSALPSPDKDSLLPYMVTDSAASIAQELRVHLQEQQHEKASHKLKSPPCVSRLSSLPSPPSVVLTPQSHLTPDLNVSQVNQVPADVNVVSHPVSRQLPAVQSPHAAHLSTLTGSLQHPASQFMPPNLYALNPCVDAHHPLSEQSHASRPAVQPPTPPWSMNPPLFSPVYPGF